MKTYHCEQIIDVDAHTAWRALGRMGLWLPRLSTVADVTWDGEKPFFAPGRRYAVLTPEKITMKSELASIDPKTMAVMVRAHWLALHSQLRCSIVPVSGTSCKIIREQSYPGVVGRIFTAVFGRREAAEAQEYLNVWADDARAAARG